MTHVQSHDAYLAALPADRQAALGALRAQLRGLLPEAEEVMSYAMPGFRIGRHVIAGYAAFARNCGYYPHSGNIVPQLAAELDAVGLRHSGGAVQFTPDRPLPAPIVARLVALRLAEVGAELGAARQGNGA